MAHRLLGTSHPLKEVWPFQEGPISDSTTWRQVAEFQWYTFSLPFPNPFPTINQAIFSIEVRPQTMTYSSTARPP